jgi:hypothetical protein
MSLEISHVVTNGCSYTYGQGLYNPPVEAWPALLAKKIGVPIVNIADPGSSNDGIVRRTYNYFYKNFNTNSKPLYVVAMSQSHRMEQYYSEYTHRKGMPEVIKDYMYVAAYDQDDPVAKALYEQLDDHGLLLCQEKKYRLWASLINLFRAHHNPYFIGDYMPDDLNTTHDFMTKNYSELYNFVNYDPFNIGKFNFVTKGYPKAKDGGHDGAEAQVVLADYVYKKILEKYDDIKVMKDADFITLKNFQTSYKRRFEINNKWYRYEMNLPYPFDYDM